MGRYRMIRRVIMVTAVLVLAGAGMAFGEESAKPVMPEMPPPKLPEPQMFCGYCHVLTYPGIVQKGYELWKAGKHNKTGCVECHYPPQARQGPVGAPGAESLLQTSHVPKQPPERFSYLQLGGMKVKTRPRIVDASCMTANCHGRPEDQFRTKKIQFTEKVSYIHEPHLDEKKQIEGQKLNCTSCHERQTDLKKFEVSQASCHLCHFTNAKFNEGRGRCELCHQLPEKPIQTSGQEPITHQMLKEAKVSCSSCHFELIQSANGASYQAFFEDGVLKTAVVLGAGRTKPENCLACHDQAKNLKEAANKKLMHEKHVSVKNARCFECHQPVRHVKADLEKEPLNAQPLRDGCLACHKEPHRYQRLLAAGQAREGVFAAPDPMFKARTNCLACHVEQGASQKGEMVLKASAATCVQCHTKDHEKMFKDWKAELSSEIQFAGGLEQEALSALEKFKERAPAEKLKEARELLEAGLENLNIVRYGNGVHNKKYAMLLIDAAIGSFDDAIAFVKENSGQ